MNCLSLFLPLLVLVKEIDINRDFTGTLGFSGTEDREDFDYFLRKIFCSEKNLIRGLVKEAIPAILILSERNFIGAPKIRFR